MRHMKAGDVLSYKLQTFRQVWDMDQAVKEEIEFIREDEGPVSEFWFEIGECTYEVRPGEHIFVCYLLEIYKWPRR